MRVSNCTEFEAYLNASIENRTRPDEAALTEHANRCAACRQRLNDYRLLDRAVAAWKADVVEVDLVEAVLAHHAFNQPQTIEAEPFTTATVDTETARPEPGSNGRADNVNVYLHPDRQTYSQPTASHSRGVYAVLTVAAVLLVVVANPFSRPPTDLPPTENVATTSEVPLPEEAVSPESDVEMADVEMIVRDAGSAYIELARGAADIFTDTVVLIPEPVIPQNAGDSRTNDTGETQPWGQELAPIRRDVGHAIDFLFNTIASEDEPAT